MGKSKREMGATGETGSATSESSATHKKHKKHKHRKHKKKKGGEEEPIVDEEVADAQPETSFRRLKIRLGSSPPVEAGDAVAGTSSSAPEKRQQASQPSPSKGPQKSGVARKRKRGSASSDEERWLDAIESGKLHEVDEELRKIKDPKLMTARQRAMLEKKVDESPPPAAQVQPHHPPAPRPGHSKKPALPKEKASVTKAAVAAPSPAPSVVETSAAEEQEKKALKSQKRRQMAEEKKEKDKRKTMERLLKKQESKAAKAVAKPRGSRKGAGAPKVTYVIGSDVHTISMPVGMDFPLKPQVAREPPPIQLCGVPGCGQRKKYSCSRTGVPLCSLECYKANLQAHTATSA